MTKRSRPYTQEPITTGNVFVVQRPGGRVDSIHVAETDVERVSYQQYVGNHSEICKIDDPHADPAAVERFRMKWTFKDGGILRPATREELLKAKAYLKRMLSLVNARLK